jgi:hypothetical protein
MERGTLTMAVSIRRAIAIIAMAFLWLSPATASHLVTGNGHGFAVVTPNLGAATKF